MDLVTRWMNHEGLVYRVWYLGRGRVRKLIQGKRFMEFLDGRIPEFSEYSEHRACRVHRWRRDNARKGQAASSRVQVAKRKALKATGEQASTTGDEQRDTIIDPCATHKEP